MMRQHYCLPEETVTDCPICGKMLLEGPGMTQREKKIRRLKGLKDYHNLPKHIVNHADTDPHYGLKSPPRWKDWDQAKQISWIMEQAAEYISVKLPKYELVAYVPAPEVV